MNIALPKKVIVYNRLIHNYSLLQKFEAGISLYGWQIKSLRHQRVELSNTYVTVLKKEVFINNLYIQPLIQHLHSNMLNYRSNTIKLLLHKKEIVFIYNQINKKGYTIILICLFWKYKWCKALISVAKGKKTLDKRREIKEKEWKINKSRLNKHLILF